MLKFDSAGFKKIVQGMGGCSKFARLLSAEKCRIISPQQITAWTSGRSAPNGENLIAISRVAEIAPDELYREGTNYAGTANVKSVREAP